MIMRQNYRMVPCFFLLVLALCSCSTRDVHDNYFGATEQRLVTQSIDGLAKMLPEKDFNQLQGQKVHLICHFIEDDESLNYAKERLRLELLARYQVVLVADPEGADKILHVFFNAIGTDRDSFGLRTPGFIFPGVGGSTGVDIIALDMYHGVSELYYYIIDQHSLEIVRGDKIRSIIRTDKLALPIISIPITTLD